MAVYSVVGREDEPDDEQEIGGAAAVLRYALAATKADDARALRGAAAPPVVLDLPELVPTEDAPTDWWTAVRDRVFWVGIAAGGLLAIVLIWNPNKQERQQIDQAPTWSTTAGTARVATPAASQHSWPAIEVADAPHWKATETHNATAAQPGEVPTVETPAPEQPNLEQPPLEAPAPGHDAAPSIDEFGRPRSDDAALHTARGSSDTVWDGRAAAPAQPGEAAPTGTIINTLVNP
jgi:hypothetical protein